MLKLVWHRPDINAKILEKGSVLNERLEKGESLCPDDKALLLLYRALNYKEHSIWSQEPKIPTTHMEEYKKAFKWFLDKGKLSKVISGLNIHKNSFVNLLLVHIFIPISYAEDFIRACYYLYKNFDGDETQIDNITKEELKKRLETLPVYFEILVENNSTFEELKKTIKNVFKIFNEDIKEEDYLPDWFKSKVEIFKIEAKARKRKKRPYFIEKDGKIKLENQFLSKRIDFVFFKDQYSIADYSKYEDKERKEIILGSEPKYVVVKKSISTDLYDDYSIPLFEDGDYHIYRVNGRKLQGKNIAGYRINVEILEGSLVRINGDEIKILKPLDYSGAKIYYNKAALQVDFSKKIEEVFVEKPDGDVEIIKPSLNNRYFVYDKEGIYKVSYLIGYEGIPRLIEKVFYVLNEAPQVNYKEKKVKYKLKEYKENKVIKESFGRFRVIFVDLKNWSYDKNKKLIIEFGELPPEGYLRIYNNCWMRIISFKKSEIKDKKIEVDLKEFEKKVVYPLRVLYKIKGNEYYFHLFEINPMSRKERIKRVCAKGIFLKTVLIYTMGSRSKVNGKFVIVNPYLEDDDINYILIVLNQIYRRNVQNIKIFELLEDFLNNFTDFDKNILKKVISRERFLKIINKIFVYEE